MMSFGRPDGADTEWCSTFKICGDYMDTNDFWTIRDSTKGNFTFAHEYSDTFGQIIHSEKHGLNTDDEIRVFRNEFNEMGNVIRKYMPWSNKQRGSGKEGIYQEFTYLNATDNVATVSQMDNGNNIHETRYEYHGPGGLQIRKFSQAQVAVVNLKSRFKNPSKENKFGKSFLMVPESILTTTPTGF